MQVGYRTYSLEYIRKLGSSYEKAAKSPSMVEIDNNVFIEFKDFEKLYYRVKEELINIENYTLNFIDGFIVWKK